MKYEKLIKEKLEEIKNLETEKGNIKEQHITPRNYGWIKALEWVLKKKQPHTAYAKFISVSFVRGVNKHRWECGSCKGRMSLDPQKKEHTCRFCKNIMILKKQVIKK